MKCDTLPKTIFLLKVNHMQLKKAFLCFEAFLPEIDKKTSLRDQKSDLSQKEAKNYPGSNFFLTNLNLGKS